MRTVKQTLEQEAFSLGYQWCSIIDDEALLVHTDLKGIANPDFLKVREDYLKSWLEKYHAGINLNNFNLADDDLEQRLGVSFPHYLDNKAYQKVKGTKDEKAFLIDRKDAIMIYWYGQYVIRQNHY